VGLGGLAEGGQQAVVIAGPGGQHYVARLFVTMDGPASSALTRERTGWQPIQPGLIPDLDKGHYFD
jgi:hypothetical protein